MITTVYVVLSLITPSFDWIQFRLGEALMILPFYNKKMTTPITIGCFLVNIFSTVSPIDMIVGTLATWIACQLIAKAKTDIIAPLLAGIVNGSIIGLMLAYVLHLPFVLTFLSITISEFLVVGIGTILLREIKKYPWFEKYILST